MRIKEAIMLNKTKLWILMTGCLVMLLAFNGVIVSAQESEGTYTVLEGDTWDSIAAQFGVTVEALQEANPDVESLEPDVVLIIPVTEEPTVEPTEEPTVEPTEEPTAEPTEEPTVEPTEEPTVEPTEEPTVEPTEEPTVEPTEEPTAEPTQEAVAEEVSPQEASGGPWNSAYAVQNLGGSPTSVDVVYHAQGSGSSPGAEYSDTVASSLPDKAGAFVDVSGSLVLPSVFNGSAVIQAGATLAAVALLADTSGLVAMAAYSGFNEGAQEMYVPIVTRSWGSGQWYTSFTVQNTSSSGNAEVTVQLIRAGDTSPTLTKTASIPPGESRTFDQSTDDYAALGAFNGFAKITCDASHEVAVVSTEWSAQDRGMYFVASGVPASQGGRTLYAPNWQKAWGTGKWDTGIQVVNVGTASTTVTATYYGTSPSGTWTEVQSISQGGAATFYQPTGPMPSVSFGAVRFESTASDIVGMVNQYSYAEDTAMCTALFNPTAATPSVAMPLFWQGHSFKGSSDWRTGIQIQNLGGSDTQVTLTLYESNGTPHVMGTQSISADGGGANWYSPSMGITGSYTAIATSNNSQPLAGLINVYNYSFSGDGGTGYEGINY
jgi:LysM repeat protein